MSDIRIINIIKLLFRIITPLVTFCCLTSIPFGFLGLNLFNIIGSSVLERFSIFDKRFSVKSLTIYEESIKNI